LTYLIFKLPTSRPGSRRGSIGDIEVVVSREPHSSMTRCHQSSVQFIYSPVEIGCQPYPIYG